MHRRGLLWAGTGLAATAASAGLAAEGTGRASRSSPSVFDFGAAGDGKTDDSAAFAKALQHAAAEGQVVTVPSFTYAIARPIAIASGNHVGRAWGLACQGATLASKITNGASVLSLSSTHIVRYFRISGGLTITGNGAEGNGIHLFAPGGGPALYNALLEGVAVEKVGGHGLLAQGNVFESMLLNCYFQDCKKNGATFAHSKGGVCSAISAVGCFFNQNGNYGLAATNLDGPHGGTTDVRVHGGYCRDNKSYGFFYNNGTSSGGAIEQVGFENNCAGLAPGDPNGAHIFGQGAMQLRSCTGYNEYGGATYLLRGWFNGLTLLDACGQAAGEKVKATGASRLVQVNGSGSGHVLMRACSGGVEAVRGTACTWAAEHCTGPSPMGALNPRGVVSSV